MHALSRRARTLFPPLPGKTPSNSPPERRSQNYFLRFGIQKYLVDPSASGATKHSAVSLPLILFLRKSEKRRAKRTSRAARTRCQVPRSPLSHRIRRTISHGNYERIFLGTQGHQCLRLAPRPRVRRISENLANFRLPAFLRCAPGRRFIV